MTDPAQNKGHDDDANNDDDAVTSEPATSGHSDADTQTERNAEDESPS